jgi:hypothetical protein
MKFTALESYAKANGRESPRPGGVGALMRKLADPFAGFTVSEKSRM